MDLMVNEWRYIDPLLLGQLYVKFLLVSPMLKLPL